MDPPKGLHVALGKLQRVPRWSPSRLQERHEIHPKTREVIHLEFDPTWTLQKDPVALSKLQTLPRWSSFSFVESKLCRQVFGGIKAVQTWTFQDVKNCVDQTMWSQNCADKHVFVESKLCRQDMWNQNCAVIFLKSQLRRFFVCGVKVVQTSLFVASKLCRENMESQLCRQYLRIVESNCAGIFGDVKVVQTRICLRSQNCAGNFFAWYQKLCRQNISYGVRTWQKTLFVESKLCIQQFAWSQNSADNKMWSQHCAGISFVVSKLCRPAFLWSQSCADLFFV